MLKIKTENLRAKQKQRERNGTEQKAQMKRKLVMVSFRFAKDFLSAIIRLES